MKNYKSVVTAILIALIYCCSAYIYKPYKALYYRIGGDAFAYYLYLPAVLIHHDVSDLKTTLLAKYKHCNTAAIVNNEVPPLSTEAAAAPNGRPVIKYSMGVAVMQLPFFLIAHFLARLLQQPQDGFSMIYMYAIQISVIFYVLMGFLLIIQILSRSFSDMVIVYVIVTLGLATNLYYLMSINDPISHGYLFFLYALLIYATISYYDTLHLRFLLLISFCCGMIILTRPNEIYAVFIPLFWGLRNMADVRGRIKHILAHIPAFAAAFGVLILCLVPQLIYWKVVSGHFLYYSYGDEKFNFADPHILDGLFSFQNGWLAYSPVMYLALMGIWFVLRRRDASLIPLLAFLPLHIYVIYSWWCWFYTGSYGSRPMTEAYPLLSIPLAFTIDWFYRSWFRKVLVTSIIVFFSWLAIFQAYQTSINIFNSEIGNWRFNLLILGKTKLTYDEAVVTDTREYQPKNPVFVKRLCESDYEDSTLTGSTTEIVKSGHRSVCVRAQQFGNGCEMTLRDAGGRPGQWVKASVNCYAHQDPFNFWQPSSLVIEFSVKGGPGKWTAIRMQNKIGNPDHCLGCCETDVWGKAYFSSQIPDNMKMDDKIRVYIMNGNHSGPDIYIDDLSVDLYDAK